MATATFLAWPYQTNDAQFRDWGSKLSAAIASLGFVKMPDTGTIDWGTVAIPGAVNTVAGWEMWRFNDSLQATYPLYFKIEYGTASGSATYPSTWWTVGVGTNGSGTIQTPLSNARVNVYTTGAAQYDVKSYLSTGSSGGSLLVVALFGASFNNNIHRLCAIERTCDNVTGVYNGTGVYTLGKTGSTSWNTSVGNYATKTVLSTPIPGVSLVAQASTSFNGTTPISKVSAVVPQIPYEWSPRFAVGGWATDIGGPETTITVPGWGTYMSTGGTYFDTTVTYGTSIFSAIAWS